MQRLVYKPLGFSQSAQLHNIVIGLLGNRYACGRAVYTWPSPLLKH